MINQQTRELVFWLLDQRTTTNDPELLEEIIGRVQGVHNAITALEVDLAQMAHDAATKAG